MLLEIPEIELTRRNPTHSKRLRHNPPGDPQNAPYSVSFWTYSVISSAGIGDN